MEESPAVLVYATYRVVGDGVAGFRALALHLAKAAIAREGCVFLDVAEDVRCANTFRLIEGWRDRTALDAHFDSHEFKQVLKSAETLGIVERRVDIYAPTQE